MVWEGSVLDTLDMYVLREPSPWKGIRIGGALSRQPTLWLCVIVWRSCAGTGLAVKPSGKRTR
eukprot:2021256-Amphidinium_carterae.1